MDALAACERIAGALLYSVDTPTHSSLRRGDEERNVFSVGAHVKHDSMLTKPPPRPRWQRRRRRQDNSILATHIRCALPQSNTTPKPPASYRRKLRRFPLLSRVRRGRRWACVECVVCFVCRASSRWTSARWDDRKYPSARLDALLSGSETFFFAFTSTCISFICRNRTHAHDTKIYCRTGGIVRHLRVLRNSGHIN